MKNPLRRAVHAMSVIAICSAFIFNPVDGFSQEKIARHILELKTRGRFKEKVQPFTTVANKNPEISKVVRNFSVLNINNPVLENILEKKPENLKMIIPGVGGTENFTILLFKTEISQAGYTLLASDNSAPLHNNIVSYRGSIDNDIHSVVAFTFSKEGTMGMISNNQGNFVVGKLEKDPTGSFIIYNDKDLIPTNNTSCDKLARTDNFSSSARTSNDLPLNTTQDFTPDTQATNVPDGSSTTTSSTTQAVTAQLTSKCVNWYWEIDYDVFVNKGSLANVNAYIQGIFNQVATLYANDGIAINLKTLFVWTTPDPYTGPNTGSYLNQFGAYRKSWNGDLAHLVGFAGSGGIAYVNGIQICEYGVGQGISQMGYSGISSSYSSVPTYSWTVGCIAHEQGHQLGSNHTHDCVWNGNNTKIDDCGGSAGYSAGTCLPQPSPVLPVGGGTIMSYCHLTSAGINFNMGFGPLPRTLITNKINSSTCLTSCAPTCTMPAQPGTITGVSAVCASTSKTYSVVAVPGATSYSWTIPSGWSGTSSTTSITVTTGSLGGVITVKSNNACGSSAAQSLSVTSGLPLQPGSISGNNVVCPASAQSYSVSPVSGATAYTWTLPAGWVGTSTGNSIDVITGITGGTITVKATNSCGNSNTQSLSTSVSSIIPVQPGVITGNTTLCSGVSTTYSIAPVSGATEYNWSLPTGWTGTSTSNSINVTTGSTGGTISVNAANTCGTSISSSLAVVYSAIPSIPGSITLTGGTTKVCPGDSRSYSVLAVTGLTYLWTVPTGATIINGQGTNDIDVSFNEDFDASGVVTVKAVNSCGTSSARTFTMYTNLPAIPSSIVITRGNAKVCPGDTASYKVTAVAGLTYNWTAPIGGQIIEGQGTNEITIKYTSAFINASNLLVKAMNSCGYSTARSLTIAENNPATPTSISVTGGIAKVCPGDVRKYTVTLVAGMIYTWTVPTGAVINNGQGTNSIEVSYDENFEVAANISVKASNNCATSSARTLLITPNLPLTPGSISGSTNVCKGSITTYSISNVTNATSYIWTVPAGATIQGSQNTTSIKVLWESTAGVITVKSVNNCGISASRSLTAYINCPSSFVNAPQNINIRPSVFPNPTEGLLTLSFYAEEESQYDIILNDLTGRVLNLDKITAVHGNNTRKYNWSHLAAGVYLVTIKNKLSSSVVKFEMR